MENEQLLEPGFACPKTSSVNGDVSIPIWRKIMYAIGGLPKNSLGYVISVYFMAFMLETAFLPTNYAALVLLFGRLLDACSDVLTGFIFSRTTTRFGKYRPWLIISAPFGCLFYTLLWYVPEGTTTGQRTAYYLFMYWLFHFAFSCYTVPQGSLILSATSCQHERDTLITAKMTVEQLGGIIGISIYGIVSAIGSSIVHQKNPCANISTEAVTVSPEEARVYAIVNERTSLLSAFVLDGIFVLAAVVAFFSLEERYVLHTVQRGWRQALETIKKVILFVPYRYVAGCLLLQSIGLGVALGNYTLYFKYVFDASEIFPLVAVLAFSASGLLMPIWLRLVLPRLGKKRSALMAAIPLMILCFCHLFFVYNVILAIFIGLFFGTFLAGVMTSIWTMLPDVIAAYSLEHGYGQEPYFYAITGFSDKFGFGISIALSTWVLGLVGYNQKLCIQPQAVKLMLRLIMALGPSISLMGCLLLIWRYPITEEKRQMIRENTKRRMSGLFKYGSTSKISTAGSTASQGKSSSPSKSMTEPRLSVTWTMGQEDIAEEEPATETMHHGSGETDATKYKNHC